MYGQRAYNQLIRENETAAAAATKGRSEDLINKRNDCLLARYYYYCYLKHKCYEDIIKQLTIEYYLSPKTISNIVLEHIEQIKELKQKAPSVYYFQRVWPYMKW